MIKLLYAGCDESEFTLEINKTVVSFMDQLAAEISREDPRLQCDVLMAGSSCERTKIDSPNEFDFNFRLSVFGSACEVLHSDDYPPGFIVLRKRTDVPVDASLDTYFDTNSGALHSTKLNFTFQSTLVKVLNRQLIWKDEMEIIEEPTSVEPLKLFKTIKVRTCRAMCGIPAGFRISIDMRIISGMSFSGNWYGP